MRIAVCNSDKRELTDLSELITQYQLSRGTSLDCRFFHNGTDLICNIKGGEYDLILMDTLMSGVSGMQTARELRDRDKNVKIIFISSSPKFAVESYSVGAYHYLLKPLDADSLFPLLDRVENELSIQEKQGFVLRNREGIVRIYFAGLEYVEVINKRVSFHLADGLIREMTAALSEFEEKLLSRPEFVKAHRSYLVNLDFIQSIGTNGIVTRNGHNIPVSRQRRSHVQDAYMQFLLRSGIVVSIPEMQEAAASEKSEGTDGPWRILLVDDDPVERTFWADILRCHGCIVQLAGNGEDALNLALDEPCDCVLLDVMIPGEDGFSICGRLRKLMNVPVIFLSCLTEADRQVKGFEAGGIDYITKDTSPELFWAKVETRIRLSMSDRTQLLYGPLLLDLAGHKVMINDKELPLTSIEFDILCRLTERAGHIFTVEEIFDMICGGQPWDGGQTVQIHMSRLRRKLEKACQEHHFIETVWGKGYRFVPADD